MVRALPGFLLGGLVSGLGCWKSQAGGGREKTEGKVLLAYMSPCQAWGGAEFLEGNSLQEC